MNASDLYMDHRELASAAELEEWDLDERGARIPTFPKTWHQQLRKFTHLMIPDAMGRSEWEQRSPALGLDEKSIQALEQHAANPMLLDVQRRIIFRRLREHMLVQLIGCSGACSVNSLCEILRAELQRGVPAPAPTWYVFSTITMGPRKIGYSACSNRDCLVTESLASAGAFKKCSNCKVPWYCSQACQASDWATRHKDVCKEARQSRQKLEQVGSFFQKLSDASLTGGLPASESMESLVASLKTPDIASRVAQRRADLKKEKLRDCTSGAIAPASDSWYNPRAAASSSQRSFQVNSVVIAQGLVTRADLNGKRCIIIGSFSEASGRWPVRFIDSGEQKLIKDESIFGEQVHNSESSDNDDDRWHTADDGDGDDHIGDE
jgi:hypothetical protein